MRIILVSKKTISVRKNIEISGIQLKFKDALGKLRKVWVNDVAFIQP